MPTRITSKLALFTPGKELVDAYLYEIAKGYGVDWTPEPDPISASKGEDLGALEKGSKGDSAGSDGGGDEGEAVEGSKASPKTAADKADKDIETDKSDKEAVPETSKLPSPEKKTISSSPAEPAPTKKLTPEEELAQRFERLKNLK